MVDKVAGGQNFAVVEENISVFGDDVVGNIAAEDRIVAVDPNIATFLAANECGIVSSTGCKTEMIDYCIELVF